MRINRAVAVLALMLIAAPACGALPANEPGAIAMAPFTFPDMEVKGMVPNACPSVGGPVFFCEALPPGEDLFVLTVSAVAETLAEVENALLVALNRTALPEPLASYRGKALGWQWYEAESALDESQGLPPPEGGLFHLDLALAEGEGRCFLMAMITHPTDRKAHKAFYDSVFTHVLYAAEPLPAGVAPEQEES